MTRSPTIEKSFKIWCLCNGFIDIYICTVTANIFQMLCFLCVSLKALQLQWLRENGVQTSDRILLYPTGYHLSQW